MDVTQLHEAFRWGGWPAVFLISAMGFGRWFVAKKLEQDKRFHDERLKEQHSYQQMLGCLTDAILALVYKTINNEEAARVMAELVTKRMETVRAAERVATHQ